MSMICVPGGPVLVAVDGDLFSGPRLAAVFGAASVTSREDWTADRQAVRRVEAELLEQLFRSIIDQRMGFVM